MKSPIGDKIEHEYQSRRFGELYRILKGRYPSIITFEDGLDASAWERETLREGLESICKAQWNPFNWSAKRIAKKALDSARGAYERHIEEVTKRYPSLEQAP